MLRQPYDTATNSIVFGERNCYFNTTGISLCGYFGFRINLNPIGKIEFYCVEELSLTKDKRALHLEEVTVSQDHDPWSLVLCPASLVLVFR